MCYVVFVLKLVSCDLTFFQFKFIKKTPLFSRIQVVLLFKYSPLTSSHMFISSFCVSLHSVVQQHLNQTHANIRPGAKDGHQFQCEQHCSYSACLCLIKLYFVLRTQNIFLSHSNWTAYNNVEAITCPHMQAHKAQQVSFQFVQSL